MVGSKRTLARLATVVALTALIGCASVATEVVIETRDGISVETRRPAADPADRLYYDAVSTQARARAAEAQARAGVAAAAAARCQTDACAMGIAMTAYGGAGAVPEPRIHAPVSRPTAWDRAFGVADRLLSFGQIVVPALASDRAQRRSTDAQVSMRALDADREARIVEAITSMPPSSQVTVGGDLVSGTQHHGDYTGGDRWQVGRDYTGRDRVGRDQIGGDQYQGPVTGGDWIGRDRTEGRRINSPGDDRENSPGPWDESGNCRLGADCSRPIRPQPPTEPIDPGGEGVDCSPIMTWNGTRIVPIVPDHPACRDG